MNQRQPQVNYLPKTCAWCAGTGNGVVYAGRTISCLVCGGKGHVSVTQQVEECPQCEGSGKRNVVHLCLTCAGTGWARVSGRG